jgi:hypothetical protein
MFRCHPERSRGAEQRKHGQVDHLQKGYSHCEPAKQSPEARSDLNSLAISCEDGCLLANDHTCFYFFPSLGPMKNPLLSTALLSVLFFSACGDDSNQSDTDSDTVVQTPVDTTTKPAATTKYAGTYSFGTDPEKATGTLLVYPINDTMAMVHLDVQNGAPAHNSGALTQSVAILADTGMIWIGNNDDGECKIALHFTGNDVTVQTHARKGCGFGANVIADNVYQRTNTEVPKYYLGGEGDTIWFNDHMESGLSMPAH